jgi:hypothetical protein
VATLTANEATTDARQRPLLIATAGTPCDPERGLYFARKLAKEVRRLQPDRDVAAVTLADDDGFAAIAASMKEPIIFPHFVCDGTVVTSELPRRLGQAGLKEWVTTVPFGLQRDLPHCAMERLRSAMRKHGLPTVETTLVLALDTHACDARGIAAAQAFAQAIAPSRLFHEVRLCFLQGDSFMPGEGRELGQTLVVPFTTAKRADFEEEVMDKLSGLAAIGPILNPIGAWSFVPELVVEAVQKHAMNLVR